MSTPIQRQAISSAALLVFIVALFGARPIAQTAGSCLDSIYRGFDSRLTVDLVGRAPIGTDPIVGFEVVNGRAVVAYPHRVVGVGDGRLVAQPSLDQISSLAVDSVGTVWIQTSNGVKRIGSERLETVEALQPKAGRRLQNSGSALFLEVEAGKSATEIGFRSPTGAHRPALRFSGRLGASSWNRDGFVAAADDTLIALPAGSRTLVKARRRHRIPFRAGCLPHRSPERRRGARSVRGARHRSIADRHCGICGPMPLGGRRALSSRREERIHLVDQRSGNDGRRGGRHRARDEARARTVERHTGNASGVSGGGSACRMQNGTRHAEWRGENGQRPKTAGAPLALARSTRPASSPRSTTPSQMSTRA